jgi:hypothetical protein
MVPIDDGVPFHSRHETRLIHLSPEARMAVAVTESLPNFEI